MTEPVRIGVLSRGDPEASPGDWDGNRLHRIFEELETHRAAPENVVFAEEAVDDVRRRLLALDGVLVWVDPIVDGRDRSVLDALLRDVASQGVWVSAHPDVILKMGTKDVLVTTREMEWGSDSHLHSTIGELREQLPALLRQGARVLKQHRGNGGNGVWKVRLTDAAKPSLDSEVIVLHALRGSRLESMSLRDLVHRMSAYFGETGSVIDQPYQDRLADGMIRCYMAHNRVAGFGHQLVTALLDPPPGSIEVPAPPPRLYYGPDKPDFRPLKNKLESGWIAEMQRLLDIDTASLPAIWDADFLLGPKTPAGEDTYVLCEINVSSVFPIPDEAPAKIGEAAVARAAAARARRRA